MWSKIVDRTRHSAMMNFTRRLSRVGIEERRTRASPYAVLAAVATSTSARVSERGWWRPVPVRGAPPLPALDLCGRTTLPDDETRPRRSRNGGRETRDGRSAAGAPVKRIRSLHVDHGAQITR